MHTPHRPVQAQKPGGKEGASKQARPLRQGETKRRRMVVAPELDAETGDAIEQALQKEEAVFRRAAALLPEQNAQNRQIGEREIDLGGMPPGILLPDGPGQI